MRPRIENLNVDALEWAPLGPDGLYSKLLSFDPETGARTALQRMNPHDGYAPPTMAHFHTTYEEILGVKGRFSFDQKTWVEPCSYVFHPPRTVHGFASAVPQDSWFLSRVGRKLDVNLVETPAQTDLYVIEGDTPPRRPCAMGAPLAILPSVERILPGGSGAVSWCELSVDPATGEGSALMRLPAGWRFATSRLAHYLELFSIEGGLWTEGCADPRPDAMSYHFYGPGEPIGPLVACDETLAYINFGAAF